MPFTLVFSETAKAELERLDAEEAKRYRIVQRMLGYMETNLRHNSLNTHEFKSLKGANGRVPGYRRKEPRDQSRGGA